MQVTETKADGLKHELKVVVSASDIQDKVQHRLEELRRNVKLPGFRPGKVPLALVRKRYGQAIMGEILERAVTDSSQQALAERGLRPALQPKIEVTAFAEESDLEYTMAVETLPEIGPVEFSKLEVERLKVAVPESTVDSALQRIAEQNKVFHPVTDDRPAQKGDRVVIDFVGRIDGEAFEGGSSQDHAIELGSGNFVGTFEDQLVGHKAGEQVDVAVTFPEGYGNEKLAGKEAVFTVDIKAVEEPEPAAADDALAERLGVESLENLRKLVTEQIERDYNAVARTRMKRSLLDSLAETHSFPVPEGMVDLEFDAIWKSIEEDRARNQVDPADANKSEEELKAEYRQIAERRVRLGLLLSEVGRLNNISVSQEDLQRAVLEEARRHPGQERQVFEFYQKMPNALDRLRAPLFEDKVIDFILEMAQVKEREVSPDELLSEVGGDAEEKTEAPREAP